MPYSEDQPPLVAILCAPAIKQVVKKSFLGKPYIRQYDLFDVLSYVYMLGAVLGRAVGDRTGVLGKMLVEPSSKPPTLMKFLQDTAKKRLEGYISEVGKYPNTFVEFVQLRELDMVLKRMGLSLDGAYEAYRNGEKRARQVFDHKVKLENVEPHVRTYLLQGIGFGSTYPKLTEKMYRNNYELANIDPEIRTWFA